MTKGEYLKYKGIRTTIKPQILKQELDEEFKHCIDILTDNFVSFWDDSEEDSEV